MAGVPKYEDKGVEVIIFGDMNVRTAQENDFSESTDDNDIDDYLPIPDDFELDYQGRIGTYNFVGPGLSEPLV